MLWYQIKPLFTATGQNQKKDDITTRTCTLEFCVKVKQRGTANKMN